ncbi:TlpA family protein disulfide reductase [Sediminibacillus massiliensis]|uniref:TlpA family protein disulfide reductase n=1 Tax=Sediminibacillus massiliensis TaxID=1926277 RepID=UPI000988709F|nr:TlpA disulfide reductase family protein [Sediminibacillus massiliensis]
MPFIDSNELYQLEEDKGKIVVITFWVSWCPDCAVDLPKKEQLYQTMDREKVKMMTINVTGREREEKAGLSYKEKFLKQPTLADENRKVYERYNCEGVPSTVIIDQDGELRGQFGEKANFLEIVKTIGGLLD